MRPRWVRQMRALLLKDLRLELRTRETLVAMVLFSVLAIFLLQFAFQRSESDLTRFAGGLLWVVLAFTSVLGVGRSYVAERDQGVLDGLLVSPVSRLVLISAKAIAIFLYLVAVEVVVVPLVGIFFVKGPYFSELGWILLVCRHRHPGQPDRGARAPRPGSGAAAARDLPALSRSGRDRRIGCHTRHHGRVERPRGVPGVLPVPPGICGNLRRCHVCDLRSGLR